MELTTLYKRVVGLDVHQAKITACAITEDEAGNVGVELAEFGGFKRDRKALAQWVAGHRPEVVVMESTGIYWKSPYVALEAVGIAATVVNARHVKTVPGRKTDWADAQWLAMLARAGMLRASFVPPATSGRCVWSAGNGRSWSASSRAKRTGCTNCSVIAAFVYRWWSATSTASRRAG